MIKESMQIVKYLLYVLSRQSYHDRITRYNNYIEICGERNSYSKTAPDATFMRMKGDHINGQLKLAYNLQHGVDSEYISWRTSNQNPGDTVTLRNFIPNMHGNLNYSYKVIAAFAGYESEETIHFLTTIITLLRWFLSTN